METSAPLVKSVLRALQVLEAFEKEPEIGLSELACRVGLPKSSVYGLAETLKSRGYLDQDAATGKYRLGLKAFELGELFKGRLDLRSEVLPVLNRLAGEYRETTQLAILQERETVYIERVESPWSMKFSSRIGMRLPAHSSGSGKAMLAFLPGEEFTRRFEGAVLERFTPRTITDVEVLKQHLAMIAARGFAVDDEESELGVRSVAVPILDHTGQPVAAISVAGPTYRITYEVVDRIAPALMSEVYRISRRFGYKGGGR